MEGDVIHDDDNSQNYIDLEDIRMQGSKDSGSQNADFYQA